MSEKQLKESFVRNLNGTSLSEISLGISITPLCILLRGLILVSLCQTFGDVFYSWKYRLFVDFFLLVLSQILSCTVLSDSLALVVGCISVTCASGLYMIYRNRIPYKTASLPNVLQSFLNIRIEDRKVPCITTFRVFINLLTAISILAVDFPTFPRRYAKTETYGTGVMDLGVGCFTFANALISPEARARHEGKLSPLHRVRKQLVAVWPLVFLGLARLFSVKAVDYHEHVSEYGVHWNFFFTLAIVRVFSSFLLTIIPAQKIWIAATVIILSYQIALETTSLKAFILHGSDNRGTRLGFLNANREGIFSAIGYVGIYMIGVQVGSYLLQKRTLVKEWAHLLVKLTILSVMLFITVTVVQVHIEPISRRMVNLPFCIWTIGQCMAWLCMVLFCDLLLLFVQYLIPGSRVPNTWNIRSRQESNLHPKYEKIKKKIDFCLIEAINRNQLLFFLHSNIVTGVVNLVIDTIHSTSLFSLIVLFFYMFLNCMISCILHVKNITIKWW